MSILSALKQQNSSINDLAKLPQAMIMQMAQRKEISEAMVAPILARKAELADAFARQNVMANASKAQPTVMEQLMVKNAQAEQPHMPSQMQQPQMPPQMQQPPMAQAMPQAPEDVGIASQATAPMTLAGGGIIAFGGGGMTDEEDDDREESNFLAMMDAIPAGIKSIPNKISEFAKHLPQSYESAKAAASRNDKDSFIAKIERLESRGQDYDKHGNILTSEKGAKGRMQVMDKTNLDPGFGVKPAQDNSPEERARVGRDYAMALKHHYNGNEKLAAMAYNWGPGNVNKLLASDGKVVIPKETQKYASNFAHGGEIRHFANDGYVGFGQETPYDPDAPSIYDTFGSMIGSPVERLKNSIYGVGAKTNKELAQEQKTKKTATTSSKPNPQSSNVPTKNVPTNQDFQNFDQAAALYQAENMGRNAPMQAQETPKSGMEAFMEQMNAQKADIAKQRAEDKNMALLTAGLGMLGGTSQYALENIGKGALAGVQNLSESNKQRIAEQNALNRNMLYGHHYQGVEAQAKENALANQAYRGETLRETSRANTNKEIEHAQANFNQYLKVQQDNLKARFPAGEMDPGYQAAMAALQKSAPYLSLAKRAGFDIASPAQTTFTPKQESLLDKYLLR